MSTERKLSVATDQESGKPREQDTGHRPDGQKNRLEIIAFSASWIAAEAPAPPAAKQRRLANHGAHKPPRHHRRDLRYDLPQGGFLLGLVAPENRNNNVLKFTYAIRYNQERL
jgi:hypothetical protein